MLKQDAIQLLGGSVASAAAAIGITYQAVDKWPDKLPLRLIDRVIAGLVKQGRAVPKVLLAAAGEAEREERSAKEAMKEAA